MGEHSGEIVPLCPRCDGKGVVPDERGIAVRCTYYDEVLAARLSGSSGCCCAKDALGLRCKPCEEGTRAGCYDLDKEQPIT